MPRRYTATEAPQFSVKHRMKVEDKVDPSEIRNYSTGMALLVRDKAGEEMMTVTASTENSASHEVQQEDIQNLLGGLPFRLNDVCLGDQGNASTKPAPGEGRAGRRLPASKTANEHKTATPKVGNKVAASEGSRSPLAEGDSDKLHGKVPKESNSVHDADKKAKDKKGKSPSVQKAKPDKAEKAEAGKAKHH